MIRIFMPKYHLNIETGSFGDITWTSQHHKPGMTWLFVQQHIQAKNKGKTQSLILLALCEGNPPVTGRFLSQRASNVEKHCHMSYHHHKNTNNIPTSPVSASSRYQGNIECDRFFGDRAGTASVEYFWGIIRVVKVKVTQLDLDVTLDHGENPGIS